MFSSFKQRSVQAELMDDPHIGYDDFRDCLRDLETVNRLTLAYRPLSRWLRRLCRRPDTAGGFSILDVGCGGGDSLRFIARRVAQDSRHIALTGVDLNPWSRRYAEVHSGVRPGIEFVTADIFRFEPAHPPDFIISSLFTHHLDDRQLIAFLRWMEARAVKGWFINDLHRHPLAFHGFRILSGWLGFHYMVQHDGPISVARAFSRNDWIGVLAAAGIARDDVKIEWFFPFRYCLTRHKK